MGSGTSAARSRPDVVPVAPTHKTLTQVEPRIPISGAPFFISSPGSYYLTGNLTVGNNLSGITVTADRVTIDLNGFSLVGQPGTGKGITVVNNPRNITVRNGVIEGWGIRGIEAGGATDSRYEGLTFVGNGLDGLMCGNNCIVTGCIARDNGEDGIDTGENCIVTGCTATGNQSQGFEVEGYSVLSGCTAASNGSDGIFAFPGSRVTNCVADRNTSSGISTGGACSIVGNSCSANGAGGTGAGISTSGGDTRIEANNVTGNDYGIRVLAAGNLIIRNSASGNTTANLNIVGGNSVGPSVTAASIPGSSNPHANYEF